MTNVDTSVSLVWSEELRGTTTFPFVLKNAALLMPRLECGVSSRFPFFSNKNVRVVDIVQSAF